MRVILTNVRQSGQRAWNGGTSRVRAADSLLERLLIGSLVLVLTLLAIAVLLPLAIVLVLVGAVGGALVWAWIRIKLALTRARMPNGALDGRKNVRVVRRDPGEP